MKLKQVKSFQYSLLIRGFYLVSESILTPEQIGKISEKAVSGFSTELGFYKFRQDRTVYYCIYESPYGEYTRTSPKYQTFVFQKQPGWTQEYIRNRLIDTGRYLKDLYKSFLFIIAQIKLWK